MMRHVKLCVGLFITLATSFLGIQQSVDAQPVNNRPVIGVLAQASSHSVEKYGTEYVMSEYIKFLEMAGASVVIVKGEQPKDYYVQVFKRVNGILLPGGAVDLKTSPYARSSQILYALAVNANDKGDYFPIWGTCQGFEMLTVLTSKENVLQSVDAENLLLPLNLAASYSESRMLGQAPKEIISYLTTESLTANFHTWALLTETYRRNPTLNKFYHVLSVNKERKGKEFVSTMEAFHYPFYGTQWHPEKNIFTRRLDQHISHSYHAIKVTQYFANFFVNEARKNFHKFASEAERSRAVVENDHRVFLQKHYIEDFFYNVTTGW